MLPSSEKLPELLMLERLLESIKGNARVTTLSRAYVGDLSFPLHAVTFGTADPQAPALALIAGVHGLERIGTQVLLSYLQTVIELREWDPSFRSMLERTRLVFIPLVNPGGMYLRQRANPNGVDLMRNAPIHGEKISRLSLFSGHRLSRHLPWYRGPAGAPMESESQSLCDFVRGELFPSKVLVTVDIHSGFGAVDRIWFPYARTRKPFPGIAEMLSLKLLLDRTYPNHIYCVEPQSRQYTAHGDLWDYLYDEHRKRGKASLFLPLCLELGSWSWVKKNLRQVFSSLGPFNPLIPHRHQRTLRRHLLFFEFLQRAVLAPEVWAEIAEDKRDTVKRRALELWHAK